MIDAIVLAGASNDGKLETVSEASHEALIDVHGRPMIEWVLEAVRACPRIRKIVVVSPETVAEGADLAGSGAQWTACGHNVVENMLQGIAFLEKDGGPTENVLLVTSDIPLLTAEAVSDFIDRCEQCEADLYYPIVSQEANEATFPGVRRTYVTLKEGVFTGGNMALLKPGVVSASRNLIEQAFAMRKKPWQLSRLLGFRFIVKLLFRRLAIREIEARITDILGCRGMAVICPYPEVGFDVDKPADLHLTREIFARREEGRADAES